MSSINLKILQNGDSSSIDKRNRKGVKNTYVYKDLKLDLQIGFLNTNDIGDTNDTLIDIDTINDIAAIQQSIINIFNTIPGQKLLNPHLGINLLKYLFEPITNETGEAIADTILNGLPRQEPRIIIDGIKVVGFPDEQIYEIEFAIVVPHLNNNRFPFNGTMNSDGFKFIN